MHLAPPSTVALSQGEQSGLRGSPPAPSGRGPPAGRLTLRPPLPCPAPSMPLPTGEAATGCGLSAGTPATHIRQKARFKIRDAKCHLRPRSREPAKEAPRQLLLGEWAAPVPAHVVGSGTPRTPDAPQPAVVSLGMKASIQAEEYPPGPLTPPHPGFQRAPPRARLSAGSCPSGRSPGAPSAALSRMRLAKKGVPGRGPPWAKPGSRARRKQAALFP